MPAPYAHRLRVLATPASPFALPAAAGAPDGVIELGKGRWRRLIDAPRGPVCVAARQRARDVVELVAAGPGRPSCEHALRLARHVLGIDDDLREFHRRFRSDPLLGPALRRHPGWRPLRRAGAWEALLYAVPEQLIAYEEAVAIQRALLRRAGTRCAETRLRLPPTASRLAKLPVAELQACGLAERRARALHTCARHLSSGRLSLDGPDWARRLSRYPGIGDWTCEVVGLMGLGRHDLVPAGDDGLMKAIGRLTTGRPGPRASEADVRAFMARYEEWAGLASLWLLHGPVRLDRAPGAAPVSGGGPAGARRPGRTASRGPAGHAGRGGAARAGDVRGVP